MVRRHRLVGFTLVELLVALFAMALLAVLSWRGLDGMARAQEQTRARADEIHSLQSGLAQWTADLDALVQQPQIDAIDWNGRVFRLTRSSAGAVIEGIVVVGWSRRVVGGTSRWMRWQSPPLTTRGQVDDAWQQADAWARDQAAGAGTDVSVTGLVDWQVFFYRSDAWTNPLSSDITQQGTPPAQGGTPQPGTQVAQVPDGVRIVLNLAPGQAISGDLTRDWVRPTVGGRKS